MSGEIVTTVVGNLVADPEGSSAGAKPHGSGSPWPLHRAGGRPRYCRRCGSGAGQAGHELGVPGSEPLIDDRDPHHVAWDTPARTSGGRHTRSGRQSVSGADARSTDEWRKTIKGQLPALVSLRFHTPAMSCCPGGGKSHPSHSVPPVRFCSYLQPVLQTVLQHLGLTPPSASESAGRPRTALSPPLPDPR
jgi:hypothetical protein